MGNPQEMPAQKETYRCQINLQRYPNSFHTLYILELKLINYVQELRISSTRIQLPTHFAQQQFYIKFPQKISSQNKTLITWVIFAQGKF